MFTRTYSKEVHELLAGEGFAPELYAVEDLAVVMEYLSGWTILHGKNHEERHNENKRHEEEGPDAESCCHGFARTRYFRKLRRCVWQFTMELITDQVGYSK